MHCLTPLFHSHYASIVSPQLSLLPYFSIKGATFSIFHAHQGCVWFEWIWDIIELRYYRNESCEINVCLGEYMLQFFKKLGDPMDKNFIQNDMKGSESVGWWEKSLFLSKLSQRTLMILMVLYFLYFFCVSLLLA